MSNPDQFFAVLAKAGIERIHEPLVRLVSAGRLRLSHLVEGLHELSADRERGLMATTLRAYVWPERPDAFRPILEGADLGGDVPLAGGGWLSTHGGMLEVHAPGPLPETVLGSAAGRELAELVELTGVELPGYRIEGGSNEWRGRTATASVFTVIRCRAERLTLAVAWQAMSAVRAPSPGRS